MLTRVYGLAFETKEELEAFLKQREEAEKRDHRKLGKELDLFTFSDLVGAGLPLFTPRGQAMREAISDFLWQLSKKYGYQKVSIPHIAKLALYETSGHAAKFKDEFFYVRGAQSEQEFVMKPMNCPHHTQIYASKPRSYKELPVRLTELTMQYRDEKPGQLLGLSRVRSISIDDAHIFTTPDQIKQEVANIVRIIEEFYQALGMYKKGETFWVSLSVRDPKTPEKYLGKEENWQKAEQYLQEISNEFGLEAQRMEGEAAFYGPKLDFKFTDALGREWQLATAQIDFVQPERFGLEYTTKEGTRETPVMIHRAVAGSLERFMSILIEHFAGNFPLWLSPCQIKVIPIDEQHQAFAAEVAKLLSEAHIRVDLDDSKDGLGKKVRAAKVEKTPYWVVIGDKEIEAGKVTLESRDHGQIGQLSPDELLSKLQEEIKNKK
jgi:threonyl-tRNA synthetase